MAASLGDDALTSAKNVSMQQMQSVADYSSDVRDGTKASAKFGKDKTVQGGQMLEKGGKAGVSVTKKGVEVTGKVGNAVASPVISGVKDTIITANALGAAGVSGAQSAGSGSLKATKLVGKAFLPPVAVKALDKTVKGGTKAAGGTKTKVAGGAKSAAGGVSSGMSSAGKTVNRMLPSSKPRTSRKVKNSSSRKSKKQTANPLFAELGSADDNGQSSEEEEDEIQVVDESTAGVAVVIDPGPRYRALKPGVIKDAEMADGANKVGNLAVGEEFATIETKDNRVLMAKGWVSIKSGKGAPLLELIGGTASEDSNLGNALD